MKHDTPTQSVSERLAAWGVSMSPESLSDATRTKSRDILVDIVGLCVAARHTDYVAATKAASEPGDHIVIGHAEPVSYTHLTLPTNREV